MAKITKENNILLAKRLGTPSQQTKSDQNVSASPLQNLRIFPDIVSIFGEKVSVEAKIVRLESQLE